MTPRSPKVSRFLPQADFLPPPCAASPNCHGAASFTEGLRIVILKLKRKPSTEWSNAYATQNVLGFATGGCGRSIRIFVGTGYPDIQPRLKLDPVGRQTRCVVIVPFLTLQVACHRFHAGGLGLIGDQRNCCRHKPRDRPLVGQSQVQFRINGVHLLATERSDRGTAKSCQCAIVGWIAQPIPPSHTACAARCSSTRRACSAFASANEASHLSGISDIRILVCITAGISCRNPATYPEVLLGPPSRWPPFAQVEVQIANFYGQTMQHRLSLGLIGGTQRRGRSTAAGWYRRRFPGSMCTSPLSKRLASIAARRIANKSGNPAGFKIIPFKTSLLMVDSPYPVTLTVSAPAPPRRSQRIPDQRARQVSPDSVSITEPIASAVS